MIQRIFSISVGRPRIRGDGRVAGTGPSTTAGPEQARGLSRVSDEGASSVSRVCATLTDSEQTAWPRRSFPASASQSTRCYLSDKLPALAVSPGATEPGLEGP